MNSGQYGQTSLSEYSNPTSYPPAATSMWQNLIETQYNNLMKSFNPGNRVFADGSKQLRVSLPNIEEKVEKLEDLVVGNYKQHRFVYEQQLELNEFYKKAISKNNMLSKRVQIYFGLDGSNPDHIVSASLVKRNDKYHIQGQFLVKNYQLTPQMIEDASKWVEKRDPFAKALKKCLGHIFQMSGFNVKPESLSQQDMKKYYKIYEERRA